jgi:hypothetical protein
MKIKFTKTLGTARQTYRRGQEHDVPDAEASEYLAKGIGTAVEAVAVVEVAKVTPAPKDAAAAKPEPKKDMPTKKASK